MPCLAKTLEADDIRPKRGSTYHKLVCPGNGVVAFASALGWYSSGSRAERRRERSGQGGSEKEGARKAEVRRGGDAERGDEVEEEEGGGVRRTFTFPLWACERRLVRAAITQSSGSLVRSSATAAMLVPVGASTMVQDLHGEGPAEFHRRVRYAVHRGMSLSFHVFPDHVDNVNHGYCCK